MWLLIEINLKTKTSFIGSSINKLFKIKLFKILSHAHQADDNDDDSDCEFYRYHGWTYKFPCKT